MDAERLGRPAFPADRGEPLGVPCERADVRTVLAVNRDPLAERDVADDLVARNGSAALREPDENVLDPVNGDAVVLAPDRVTGPRRLQRDGLFVRDLLRLQSLQHLVDDLLGRDLAAAEREIEV